MAAKQPLNRHRRMKVIRSAEVKNPRHGSKVPHCGPAQPLHMAAGPSRVIVYSARRASTGFTDAARRAGM
jgi:hypothetical protein